MADILGWNAARVEREIEGYRDLVAHLHGVPGDGRGAGGEDPGD